ncbi:MAG: LLM class F420-dependent oxidoreductase [Candidatus Promineifilaceae bacterium]|nr:LLM class F420-dependent oxidoreductase [Candidatus Promineifilaceae bacterium]
MIEVALMIEGQNGLNWERWQRVAQAAEDLGFVGLFRSDHYTNANPPDKDSLELWTSLTWLADNSERLEFGPLVSPVSFREPTMTARMAAAVDDLSNGRLILGLGAGWQEREHHNFGHDLLAIPERFDRFEEGLEVITGLLESDEPVSFEGDYYELHDAILLPRPDRIGGPPILIGGNGPKRTLPLTARYADEWNGVFITATDYADRNSRLDELLVREGRQPEDVRRSLMTGTIFGRTDNVVRQKLEKRGRSAEEMRQAGLIVGTADDFVEQIERYAEAGAYRVMLQWLDLDDMDGLEAMASRVIPQLHGPAGGFG